MILGIMDAITGNAVESTLGPELGEMMMGFIGILFVIFAVIAIVLYVYFSMAFQKIGQKTGLKNPGVAWLPGYGTIAVIFESTDNHWWPFPAVMVSFLFGYALIFVGILNIVLSILGSIVAFAAMMLLAVMSVIWQWKTYEVIGRPGYWAVIPAALGFTAYFFMLIPILGLILFLPLFLGAIITQIVFVGIAAWGQEKAR